MDGFIACGAGKPKRRRQSIPETRTSSRAARNANIEGAGKSFPCPPEAEKYPNCANRKSRRSSRQSASADIRKGEK